MDFSQRLHRALQRARNELLAARTPEGHWAGELSSSALSTATAVCALAIADRESRTTDHESRIARGLDWLAAHINADGGWGDTTVSLSNISTTTLCWAAFGVVPGADEKYRAVAQRAGHWLARQASGTEPEKLVPAIIARYGRDRTFSVPILTTCALSGRLGPGAQAWKQVLPLPFELAALPHRFFASLRLPVVSYALPALIAIGQARHDHLPSRNPVARAVRALARRRTLKVLSDIQPSSGGFLEAAPLTSFVVMSLAGSGSVDHQVTTKGVEFLSKSQRTDGSWPIDTNLATWVTTLSVNALAEAGGLPIAELGRKKICDWLLAQQYRNEHPYTHAAPGGWAWTDLPGGVPDADDTAGALLALKNLAGFGNVIRAAISGVNWLLDLQNSDGGIPTFCRGWTNLPFDRSAPDLTGHAIRAWNAWLPDLSVKLQQRVRNATARAVDYLARTQRADGSWIPLWFGNQHVSDETNPVYGTARVLRALTDFAADDGMMRGRGAQWLLSAQKTDGSWGATADGTSSVEETALAVEALAGITGPDVRAAHEAAARGARWLIEKVESGEWRQPAPIGFYFAKLWYYEQLYPKIFTVAALSRVVATVNKETDLP